MRLAVVKVLSGRGSPRPVGRGGGGGGSQQTSELASVVIVQYLPQMPVKTPGGRAWRMAHSASETGRAHVGRVQYPPMNMLLTARQVHTITAEPSFSPPVCRTKP